MLLEMKTFTIGRTWLGHSRYARCLQFVSYQKGTISKIMYQFFGKFYAQKEQDYINEIFWLIFHHCDRD